MIDVLSAANSRFLYDLQNAQSRNDRAQRQLSSGYRVERPSDDPTVASSIIQSGADLSRYEQVDSNLGMVKAEVDAGEGALAQAVKLVDQARTAGTRGASTTTTTQQRQILADQVGDILRSLVNISNTSVNGRYIFSGDADQTTAYSIDLTQPSPIGAYQGTTATRQVQDASGNSMPVARDAQQIFDDPSNPANSVFKGLTALRTALLNDDPAAASTAMDSLTSAAQHLNSEQARFGGYQTSLVGAQDDVKSKITGIKTQLSGMRDADIAQAAIEAAQSNAAIETSLAAHSKLNQRSLFDYLG